MTLEEKARFDNMEQQINEIHTLVLQFAETFNQIGNSPIASAMLPANIRNALSQ